MVYLPSESELVIWSRLQYTKKPAKRKLIIQESVLSQNLKQFQYSSSREEKKKPFSNNLNNLISQ